MDKINSKLTVLTCTGGSSSATKTFIKGENGKIDKISFSAGQYFKHEEVSVNDLQSLGKVLDNLANEPRKLVIKGQIKPNKGEIVRRKSNEPEAAFDAVARPYIMLDVDKLEHPEFMNASTDPEEVVKWVVNSLPEPFRRASCYYQFSSSQNVFVDGVPRSTVSIHLWFYCNREVLDVEWKRYFNSIASPVDTTLFSPVQMHYTANPIFKGMEDPLPKRSGFYKAQSDVVNVPDIPKEKIVATRSVCTASVVVSNKNRQKALDFLKPYYLDGSRNRLCGAISGVLYRAGWASENIAEFVYDLAIHTADEEAEERYKNAFRICDAVDRGLPAQGIPTLKKEFKIENLEDLLELLGMLPNIEKLIDSLSNKSSEIEVQEAIKSIALMPKAKQGFYLDKVKTVTKCSKATLNAMLKDVIESDPSSQLTQVPVDSILKNLLYGQYNNGEHFLRSSDKCYWRFVGTHWERAKDDSVKKDVMNCVRTFINEGGASDLNSLVTQALNLLEGEAFNECDPLRSMNRDIAPVINCLSGEVWFDDSGNAELRPHRADSFLRHCLDVKYDPKAESPQFDEAVLDIFSKSDNSNEMFRHFMELAGYICQPWRKIPMILLLYGRGSNGKTSLVKIIQRMLDENAVMSGRIGDVEKSNFKVGDLDGKLIILDDDVDGGTLLPDGFLKKISEEKPLTGEYKYKDPFQFICRAVPVMLGNDYPVTGDLTKGIRRRLQVVPFSNTYESHQIDIELFDRIWREEASGILNHVIEGFKRVRERESFEEPEDCQRARKEWLVRANILVSFIDEMCEEGEGYKTSVKDFYEHFDHYCDEECIKNKQSRKLVEKRLEALDYKVNKNNGTLTVWGLRVKGDDKEEVHVKL